MTSAEEPRDRTAAQVFSEVWTELVAMLGSAATATLVRRAAKRACKRADGLAALQVSREGWEYRYALPADWEKLPPRKVPAFAALLQHELVPLLREFTGEIVVRRLQDIAGLKELGPSVFGDIER